MIALALALLTAEPVVYQEYRAQLVSCYDGDTCTFDIRLGFGLTARKRVRFCNIDAPELKGETKKEAETARRFVESVLRKVYTARLVVPTKAACHADGRRGCETTSFDRVVAYVFAGDYELGKALLRMGYATEAKKQCPAM